MYKALKLPVFAALVCASCASSQGEEVRDARKARIDAQTEDQQQAIQDREKARSEHISRQHDAAENQVEASGAPGEGATEKLVDISQQRAQYESRTVARLNELSARINGAQQKLAVLGPRAPTQLKTELNTTSQQYDLLKRDIVGLKAVPADSWERTTEDIDRRVAQLDDRVSKLDEAIEDV